MWCEEGLTMDMTWVMMRVVMMILAMVMMMMMVVSLNYLRGVNKQNHEGHTHQSSL
jgi:uncharacterized membrane protein